jgi:hypothetical protein
MWQNCIYVNKQEFIFDSLSPLLFNFAMNEIIEDKKGYKIRDKILNMICYADDDVLIADSENNVQTLLHHLMFSCENYYMKILWRGA